MKKISGLVLFFVLFTSLSFANGLDYYGIGDDSPADYVGFDFLVSDKIVKTTSVADYYVGTFTSSSIETFAFDVARFYYLPELQIIPDESTQFTFNAIRNPVKNPDNSVSYEYWQIIYQGDVVQKADNIRTCSIDSVAFFYNFSQSSGIPLSELPSAYQLGSFDVSLKNSSQLFFWLVQ